MTIRIELGPDEEQALRERARTSGRDLADYVHRVLRDHIRPPDEASDRDEEATETKPSLEDLFDDEAVACCEDEADGSISLEEVRAATAQIRDTMARVVIEEERAERF